MPRAPGRAGTPPESGAEAPPRSVPETGERALYYHSGVNQYAKLELLAANGSAGMVNALSAAQEGMLRGYSGYPELPLSLDSGAFQGRTSPERYAELLSGLHHRFDFYANLDVIGSQRGSDANYRRLTESFGFAPMWVLQVGGKEKQSRGFALRSRSELDRLLAKARKRFGLPRGALVGVGGLVGAAKLLKPKRLFACIERVGRAAQGAGLKAHLFGMGSRGVLKRFAKAPWLHSSDSSRWLVGWKTGRVHARKGRWHSPSGDYNWIFSPEGKRPLSKAERSALNMRVIERWAGWEKGSRPAGVVAAGRPGSGEQRKCAQRRPAPSHPFEGAWEGKRLEDYGPFDASRVEGALEKWVEAAPPPSFALGGPSEPVPAPALREKLPGLARAGPGAGSAGGGGNGSGEASGEKRAETDRDAAGQQLGLFQK